MAGRLGLIFEQRLHGKKIGYRLKEHEEIRLGKLS